MNLILRISMIAIVSVLTISQTAAIAKDKKAPDVFKVKFETSKGSFVIEVQRKWAPIGADHFHALVEDKFYDICLYLSFFFFTLIISFSYLLFN